MLRRAARRASVPSVQTSSLSLYKIMKAKDHQSEKGEHSEQRLCQKAQGCQRREYSAILRRAASSSGVPSV